MTTIDDTVTDDTVIDETDIDDAALVTRARVDLAANDSAPIELHHSGVPCRRGSQQRRSVRRSW